MGDGERGECVCGGQQGRHDPHCRVEAAERPVSKAFARVRALVDEQAEDEALWALNLDGTLPISEAYMQQELRRLHDAVEAAFDTDEPQGSSPTSPVPAVSPLNLDAIALLSGDIVKYESAHSRLSVHLAEDVLALVARVRALEAVTQAAREFERSRPLPSSLTTDAPHWNLRVALAVVDGGGHDG